MTEPDRPVRHDLRLVPVAAAAWAGAWLGTGAGVLDRRSLAAVAGAALVVLALTAVAVRWRIVVAGAAALGLAGGVLVAGLAAHRVTSGPATELAVERAV
ncbi:MAG TPA: hypothetical protein VFU98_15660, partial [Microlunatus sp.]|nr:hypothetical protein [Microlunatus sp.]